MYLSNLISKDSFFACTDEVTQFKDPFFFCFRDENLSRKSKWWKSISFWFPANSESHFELSPDRLTLEGTNERKSFCCFHFLNEKTVSHHRSLTFTIPFFIFFLSVHSSFCVFLYSSMRLSFPSVTFVTFLPFSFLHIFLLCIASVTTVRLIWLFQFLKLFIFIIFLVFLSGTEKCLGYNSFGFSVVEREFMKSISRSLKRVN